jgi:hypothetical protein
MNQPNTTAGTLAAKLATAGADSGKVTTPNERPGAAFFFITTPSGQRFRVAVEEQR